MEIEDFGSQERQGTTVLTSFRCSEVTDTSHAAVLGALSRLQQQFRVTWMRSTWRIYDVLTFTDDLQKVAESFRALSEVLRDQETWAVSTLVDENDSFFEAVDTLSGEVSSRSNLGSYYRDRTVRIVNGEIKNGTVVVLNGYPASVSPRYSSRDLNRWSEKCRSLLFTWVDVERPWNWASLIPANQEIPAFAVFDRLGSQIQEFRPIPDEETFLGLLAKYA